MATKTTISMVDDIDGGNADETVKFSLDGVQYEIDLSNKNADKLRKALEGFTSKARKAPRSNVVQFRGRQAASQGGVKPDRDMLTMMRKWANEHGFQVAERGRVAAVVVAAYENNDPTMLPGYVKPDATGVKLNLSEGGVEVKTARAPRPRKAAKSTSKAASVAAG